VCSSIMQKMAAPILQAVSTSRLASYGWSVEAVDLSLTLAPPIAGWSGGAYSL